MSRSIALQPTPSHNLIQNLCISGSKIAIPPLGKRAKNYLGGQFLTPKSIPQYHASSWSSLLKLAVGFNVEQSFITQMLSDNASSNDISVFSDALIEKIFVELNSFKQELLSQIELSENSINFLDNYCGYIKVTNEFIELSSEPTIVLFTDWIYAVEINSHYIDNQELSELLDELIQSLTHVGYSFSTFDMSMYDYFYSYFCDCFHDVMPRFLTIETGSLTEEKALEFLDKIKPKAFNEFLEEFGYDSYDDIDILNLIEVAKMSARLNESHKSLDNIIAQLNHYLIENTEHKKFFDILFKLLDVNHLNDSAINAHIEGIQQYANSRPILTTDFASSLLDTHADSVMGAGENAFIAFDTTDPNELLSALKRIYSVSFCLVALQEYFDGTCST